MRSYPSCTCVSAAPRPVEHASVWREKGSEKSGQARIGAVVSFSFNVSIAFCCSALISNVWSSVLADSTARKVSRNYR